MISSMCHTRICLITSVHFLASPNNVEKMSSVRMQNGWMNTRAFSTNVGAMSPTVYRRMPFRDHNALVTVYNGCPAKRNKRIRSIHRPISVMWNIKSMSFGSCVRHCIPTIPVWNVRNICASVVDEILWWILQRYRPNRPDIKWMYSNMGKLVGETLAGRNLEFNVLMGL